MAAKVHSSDMMMLVILVLFVGSSYGFNLDTINFIRHRGEPGSMFGFSVAEHRESGQSWLLIGAPEAQTGQPGVTKGGAVFRCDVTRDDTCYEVPFDRTGNNNNSAGKQIDKKSFQWFGATVKSAGENGVVMACAPRYVWFSTLTSRRDPVGTCYVARNDFTDFSEYSPCRTRNWGYHRQGSCQVGLGADVSRDSQRLYVGAPGSWYWQGQVYEIDSRFKMPTISPDYTKYQELNLIDYESGNNTFSRYRYGRLKSSNQLNQQQNGGGQLFAQNPNKRPEVIATSEGPPTDDDSYLGYSVVGGSFDGKNEGGVAVGMPRGASLLGKVVLFTMNLTNLQNITGEQLGSYFSYSLAVVDVDGDKLDDLIVGAPLYTDLSNNEGKYETGRIYVFYQKPEPDGDGYYARFVRRSARDGTNSKGRFGLSVCSLGDINKDGFGDFAVGAPYDGVDERGAVYIFHGSSQGVREKHSQVIHAEDLSVPLTTFGFSLSGGLDLDQNEYPDLVVGAYDSDSALFFRSRPVVKLTDARVSFSSRTKQINLEEQNCTIRDSSPVTCLVLQTCLKYSGVGVERYLDMDVGIALDSKKTKSPRMFFLTEESKNVLNQTQRFTKGELTCKNYWVYIRPGIRDKLTPLEAEFRYTLMDKSRAQLAAGRRYTRQLEPVLDSNEPNYQRDSVSIQKNCGPDNVCIPDLRLKTKQSAERYLLGSGERFVIDVDIENSGEDAYEAMYNLQVPPGMNFINIERVGRDRSIPVQCSPPTYQSNNTLRCDIGNPLPRRKSVHFKVLLQPFHREGMKSSYEFHSFVNTTNPEEKDTIDDNGYDFIVPIWVETDIILQGSSQPPDVHYNLSHYNVVNATHESEVGPTVVHVYGVRNKGPSDIVEAEAYILWPSYTLAGDHLLYLLEQPETSNKVKCEYVDNANEENLILDIKRKSYLEGGSKSSHLSGSTTYESGTRVRTEGRGKVSEEEEERSRELDTAGGVYRQRGQQSQTSRTQSSSGSSGVSSGSSGSSYSGSSGSSYSGSSVSGGSTSSGSSSSGSTVYGGGSSVSRGSTSSGSSSSGSTVYGGGRSGSGGSWTEERVEYGGGSTSSQSGGSRTVETSRDRTASAGSESSVRQGGVSESVTHQEGSYRSQAGSDTRAQGEHFQWSGDNRNRGQGRNRSGEERNYEYERRLEEERRRVELNRVEEDRRRVEEERRRLEINRVEEERRRVEEERRRVDEERRRAEQNRFSGVAGEGRNNQFVGNNAGRVYGQNEFRTVTLDLGTGDSSNVGGHVGVTREQDESYNRNYDTRAGQGRGSASGSASVEGSRTYETHSGGRSGTSRSEYEERAEYDRRRLEEARGAGEGSARRYSSEYEYHKNSSWDSARGEQPRVHTSSTWTLNDNGTVTSGTGDYDVEYLRRLNEERLRNLQASSAGSGQSYSEHRYTYGSRGAETNGRHVEPEEPGLHDREYRKHRAYRHESENSLESKDELRKDTKERYRRHHDVIPRIKRDIVDTNNIESSLKCGPTNCTRIRCTIGPLKKDEEALIALRGRVWVQTLKKIGYNREVSLSSLLVSRVTRLPHIGEPHSSKVESHEVFTELMPQDVPIKPEVVPLWIVVLSACAGALILLLLIFLLWKCGFFKRNRPSDTPEKQPLNRNGYHSGDEAL